MPNPELPQVVPHTFQQIPESSLYRATFVVPADTVEALIRVPILCCGGAFPLQVTNSPSGLASDVAKGVYFTQTVFVYCDFDSREPKDTSLEIATRIARKLLGHRIPEGAPGAATARARDGSRSPTPSSPTALRLPDAKAKAKAASLPPSMTLPRLSLKDSQVVPKSGDKPKTEMPPRPPAATVQLRVPCKISRVEAQNRASDAKAQLQHEVYKALAVKNVKKKDVSLCVDWDKGLLAEIKLRSDASVIAVMEVLNEKIAKDGGDGAILTIFRNVSGNEEPPVAKPRWPLTRLQAAIKAEYGYTIELDPLEIVVSAVWESYETYRKSWDIVKSREQKSVVALMEQEPMSIFQYLHYDCEEGYEAGRPTPRSRLMKVSEGKAQKLQEDWICQEAKSLNDLLADATIAQKLLKQELAPTDVWGKTEYNDTSLVPMSDEKRKWTAAKTDLAPCGEHFDPGIKGEKRVEEKAKSRQKPYMSQPPYHDLVDISRLAIVFDSVMRLGTSLKNIVEKCDVLWVDNKFRNPSCVGYRDVNIGIRHGVGERRHVSELQLLLKDIYEVKQGPGHKYYESIRSTLAKCGVSGRHNDGVVRLILRVLDSTDFQASRNAELELSQIISLIDCQTLTDLKFRNYLESRGIISELQNLGRNEAIGNEEILRLKPEEEELRFQAHNDLYEALRARKYDSQLHSVLNRLKEELGLNEGEEDGYDCGWG